MGTNETEQWGEIVFLQGDDFDRLCIDGKLYPDHGPLSASTGWPAPDNGIKYLRQWDYGEPPEHVYDAVPECGSGTEDYLSEDGRWLVQWHWGLGWAALYKRGHFAD